MEKDHGTKDTERYESMPGGVHWPPESSLDHKKRMQADWWRRTIMMRERSREKARVVAQLHQLNHWLDSLLAKDSTELVLEDLQEIQAQLPNKRNLCELQRKDRQRLIIIIKQSRKSSTPEVAELSRTIIHKWRSSST